MRESQDRQVGQLEEGGPGNQSAIKVKDDEEVCAGQSTRGQLGDKGIGTAGDVEKVMGETLRPSSNISNDLDHNLQPEYFPVTSESDSKLIYVKPAPDTSSKDI